MLLRLFNYNSPLIDHSQLKNRQAAAQAGAAETTKMDVEADAQPGKVEPDASVQEEQTLVKEETSLNGESKNQDDGPKNQEAPEME